MSTLYPSLEALIISLVPETRYDSKLKRELIAQSEGILNRKHGQYEESDFQVISDQIRRYLLQTTSSTTAATKFTNLLSRLLDQPVLSRKHASVSFLHNLAAIPANSQTHQPPASQPKDSKGPSHRSPDGPVGTKSKAALLREYRHKTGQSHLPEHLLIRDALFLLQGISGKYVKFSANGDNNLIFSDDGRHLVPPPTRNLIHRLSEVGYLYSRVEQFVREREHADGVGMIEQSLCHHLQSQLTEYYQLIAVLESQVSSEEPDDPITGASSNGGSQNTLTLRRLDVWINEWRLRMRMMSVCVEGARDSHGGALVNLIHGYADTGDPFIRKFTDQLLEEVSEPFFTTLHKWLFSGELYDPFSEFFVTSDSSAAMHYLHPSALTGGVDFVGGDGGFGGENDETSDLREGGLQLWQTKYRFQKEMLPTFVGEAFGKKIFSTGKSLNFIRYNCHDSDWVVTREKMLHTGGTLKYSDISGLERSIDVAYQTASRRLFEVFIEKFMLLDHLLAIKQFLLLGHGDFADRLLESLGPSLYKPANTLYRHNLTATLETALQSSNAAKDPPEVLRRLDARMLEYSHGEIGWDSFTLEYKIDAPIDTVLDPASMEKYLKLFKHLWQIKRIENALSTGWMRIAGGTRSFLRVPELEPEWHRIRITMAEMIHFIRSLQAYCHLEVIECSWKTLVDFLHKREGDLDAMIEAHRNYLDSILTKALLLYARRGKEENVLNQVRGIFTSILRFRDAIDDFYNYCLSESSRRDEALDLARGVYTGRPRDRAVSAANVDEVLERLHSYSNDFSDRVPILVSHLHAHTDFDCRLLATRLSFSEFYKGRRA